MSNFKSLIWTIVGIVILIAIINFVGFILPYVLIGGLIIFLFYKIRKVFTDKNKKDNNTTFSSTYNDNSGSYNVNADDSYDGKVIDVDYKEVDK